MKAISGIIAMLFALYGHNALAGDRFATDADQRPERSLDQLRSTTINEVAERFNTLDASGQQGGQFGSGSLRNLALEAAQTSEALATQALSSASFALSQANLARSTAIAAFNKTARVLDTTDRRYNALPKDYVTIVCRTKPQSIKSSSGNNISQVGTDPLGNGVWRRFNSTNNNREEWRCTSRWVARVN